MKFSALLGDKCVIESHIFASYLVPIMNDYTEFIFLLVIYMSYLPRINKRRSEEPTGLTVQAFTERPLKMY